MLAHSEMRQVAQRITGRYHLEPLSKKDTGVYVRHRLRIAGAQRDVFEGSETRDGAFKLADGKKVQVPLMHRRGNYGLADLSTEFDIGRSQIVKAAVGTHRLVVLRDGNQVASYAASYGEEYDPGRNTPNGTYMVMAKTPVEIMDNPRYGYHDVRKTWAARFSNHGEFIHENQENAAAAAAPSRERAGRTGSRSRRGRSG